MADETITESDIWADIDAMFALPARQPGDIDAYQLMERYGGHENSARNRMKSLVKTGEWEFIIVADDTSNQGRRKVIRKVKNVINS
jgi:hypothetical protein